MKKILIIKHGALGDMVFSLPAFQAIRQHFPDAQITLLTSTPYEKYGHLCPFFDHVMIDDRKRPWTHPKYCWGILQQIKRERFDLIIDLQRSKRTRQYMRISKLWPHKPAWSSTHKGADYHLDIPNLYIDHILNINQRQIALLGIQKNPAPSLGWMRGDIKHLSLPKKYFIIVPGTSPGQDHKKWPAERYGAIAQHISEKGYTPIVLGTRHEEKDFQEIQKACPQAKSLIGKTSVFDIPEIARGAMGALGNDTGPMHFCYFSGCPSLYLFSYSSTPELCGPREKHGAVLKENNLKDLDIKRVQNALTFRKD